MKCHAWVQLTCLVHWKLVSKRSSSFVVVVKVEDRKFEVTKTDEHNGAIRLNKFKLIVGNTLKALKSGESVIVGLPELGAPRKGGDDDRGFIKAYEVTAV